MSPADAAKALGAAVGVAVTLFKIVEEHRATLPEGKEREDVERLRSQAIVAMRELWLYEPMNPTPMEGT